MTFPSTSILDDFNRPNEGPPPSANWDNIAGADGYAVVGNEMVPSPGPYGAVTWETPYGPHCEMYFTVEMVKAEGAQQNAYIRTDALLNTGYVLVIVFAAGGSAAQLQIVGSGTDIISIPPTDFGDYPRFWIRAYSDTLYLYYWPDDGGVTTDWILAGTATDSTYPDAGLLGFYGVMGIDDFGGGSLPNWTDAVKNIAAKLEVDWDKDDAYTDESAYLLAEGGATGRCSLLMPWQMFGGINAQEPWTARFALKNVDDRYSATNTDGPYYASIGTNKGRGIPLKFSVGIDDGTGSYVYTQIFQGYIDTLSIDSTTRDLATISAIDNAMMLLQHRATTTLYIDETADSWLTVLATLGNVAATSLDPGRCVIPFAWLDDEQLWVEMNKAAHSDGGFIYFSQAGTLVYENAETWITLARHTVSQYTFTVSRWQDMAPKFDWGNCYNEVVCQYQPRALRGRQEIWTLEQCDRRILPGETRTITARLRYPCAAIFTPSANVDYHIISEMGTDLTSAGTNSVAVSISAYAQRVEITIVNSDASRTAYLHDFKLRGIPLIGYPAGQVKEQATGSDIGDPTSDECKTLAIGNNEYIQTLDQAQLIAASLKDRLQKARLTYRITSVPGIPSLIPGDLVTVVEAGSEINNTGIILSYDWTFSRGAFDFTAVEVLDSASWTPYTAAQYFILGTDSPNATTSKRVFY